MGVSYIIRPSQKGKEDAALSIKIQKAYRDYQDGKPKIRFSTNILLAVPKITVNATEWTKQHTEAKYRKKYAEMFSILDAIEAKINDRLSIEPPMTSEEAKDIINSIVFADEIQKQKEQEEERKRQEEEEQKRQEEASRITLNKYIDSYLADMKSGARQTPSGGRYTPNSIKSTKQSFTKLREYQRDKQRELDFDDIDLKFHRDFTAYLMEQDYSINTIGKCFKDIKTVMEAALSDELHTNTKFRNKAFKAPKVDVDSIYLTQEELNRFMAVDLSGLPKCYDEARDLFACGVWLAQRVSDYNNIKRENIKISTIQSIEDGKIVDKELVTIELRQKKTGKKISVPCRAELRAILEKYNYNLPHLWDQKINNYIKVIGEMAGLTDLVEITSTKGGKPTKIQVPKYTLIHTHTARRTGATLMCLDEDVNFYDIMRVTGHSTPAMLMKYIKASSLEIAEKLAKKYEYFK